MNNEISYIDLGQVTPEIFSSMWEVDLVLDIKKPTIFKWKADRLLCHFWQGPHYTGSSGTLDTWIYDHTDLSSIFNSSLLSDITLMRCFEADEISPIDLDQKYNTYFQMIGDSTSEITTYEMEAPEVAYYTEDPDVSNWILLYPDKTKLVEINSLMFDTLQVILKEKHIKTIAEGNDLFFKHPKDNAWKKFVGSVLRSSENNYCYSDLAISWEFNVDATNRIRSVAKNANINIKKFKIEDIGNRVAGLFEVDSTLNREEIELDFINRICDALNCTIRNDILSDKDIEKLFNRGNKRFKDKDWQYYGINDNFPKTNIGGARYE